MTALSAAGLPSVTNEDRGREIERRANAMGIYTAREFERMSIKVDRKVSRAQYGKAIVGDASDTMLGRIEDALSLMEERTGHDEPDEGGGTIPMRFTLHNVYGIGEVIAEGHPDDKEAIVESLAKLLREIREGSDD